MYIGVYRDVIECNLCLSFANKLNDFPNIFVSRDERNEGKKSKEFTAMQANAHLVLLDGHSDGLQKPELFMQPIKSAWKSFSKWTEINRLHSITRSS